MMSSLPQNLLSAALRVLWDGHASSEQQAMRLLSERAPGFDTEQYVEARRCARMLDREAYDLAAAWFASRGRPEKWPSVHDLRRAFPGSDESDYDEAIEKNILWARK
jgi:hypothetical protein